MSLTDKPGEEREGLAFDPVLGYRIWPTPNETYKQMTVRPMVAEDTATHETELTGKTLLATCGFLLAILLVGFFTGYALRGNAYAGGTQPSLVSSAMVSVAAPDDLATTSNRSRLIATLGSQAPDELLAFDAVVDGSMTALIRLHDTSASGTDKFSLVEIAQDGTSRELFREEAPDLRSMDMARLADGRIVTASLRADKFAMQGVQPNGEADWARQLNTTKDQRAQISVVDTARGTAIAGPAEQSGRVAVIYLSHSGDLLWQRSFAADADTPDLTLKANKDGSVFVTLRNPSDSDNASHTLMRIDPNGQDMWSVPVELEAGAELSGVAATGDGGVYLLSTGYYPSLTRFNATGQTEWDILISQAKLFSSIELMTGSDGSAIVAISYALGAERVDVWIEQRSRFGDLIGETSLTLPGLSSVESVSEAGDGHYLIAGSILPNRYEDTDIFVKDFEFKRVAPAARLAPVLASSPSETVTTSAAIAAIDEPMSVAETTEPVRAPIVTASEPADTVNLPMAVAVVEPSSGANDDDVALSGFIGDDGAVLLQDVLATVAPSTVRAQCRFSCLEIYNASSTFPMWRAVEASQSDFDSGLQAQHEMTCKAAGGLVNPASTPACQGF